MPKSPELALCGTIWIAGSTDTVQTGLGETGLEGLSPTHQGRVLPGLPHTKSRRPSDEFSLVGFGELNKRFSMLGLITVKDQDLATSTAEIGISYLPPFSDEDMSEMLRELADDIQGAAYQAIVYNTADQPHLGTHVKRELLYERGFRAQPDDPQTLIKHIKPRQATGCYAS